MMIDALTGSIFKAEQAEICTLVIQQFNRDPIHTTPSGSNMLSPEIPLFTAERFYRDVSMLRFPNGLFDARDIGIDLCFS